LARLIKLLRNEAMEPVIPQAAIRNFGCLFRKSQRVIRRFVFAALDLRGFLRKSNVVPVRSQDAESKEMGGPGAREACLRVSYIDAQTGSFVGVKRICGSQILRCKSPL
jgi:hypothetical protein